MAVGRAWEERRREGRGTMSLSLSSSSQLLFSISSFLEDTFHIYRMRRVGKTRMFFDLCRPFGSRTSPNPNVSPFSRLHPRDFSLPSDSDLVLSRDQLTIRHPRTNPALVTLIHSSAPRPFASVFLDHAGRAAAWRDMHSVAYEKAEQRLRRPVWRCCSSCPSVSLIRCWRLADVHLDFPGFRTTLKHNPR